MWRLIDEALAFLCVYAFRVCVFCQVTFDAGRVVVGRFANTVTELRRPNDGEEDRAGEKGEKSRGRE